MMLGFSTLRYFLVYTLYMVSACIYGNWPLPFWRLSFALCFARGIHVHHLASAVP